MRASSSGSSARSFRSGIRRWYIGRLDPQRVPDARVRAARAASRWLHRLRERAFRSSPRTSAPTCARRCRTRSSSAVSQVSAASPSSFASDVPAVFAAVKNPERRRAARGERGRREGDGRAEDLARERARERDGRFRARRAGCSCEMLKQTERVDVPLAAAHGRRPRGSRAQPRGACGTPVRSTCPAAPCEACVDTMARRQAAQAAPCRARAQQLDELRKFVVDEAARHDSGRRSRR